MSNNWNDVINADLADVVSKPKEPIANGTYQVLLSDVEAKTFKSGSKGLQLTYVITTEGPEKGRDVRDFFIIRKPDGSPDRQGAARTKKLLVECGLTPEDISKFKFPEFDSKLKADFKRVVESALTLELENQVTKKGPNAGKSYTRVLDYTKAA